MFFMIESLLVVAVGLIALSSLVLFGGAVWSLRGEKKPVLDSKTAFEIFQVGAESAEANACYAAHVGDYDAFRKASLNAVHFKNLAGLVNEDDTFASVLDKIDPEVAK